MLDIPCRQTYKTLVCQACAIAHIEQLELGAALQYAL